jgi:hypothetical protein
LWSRRGNEGHCRPITSEASLTGIDLQITITSTGIYIILVKLRL